MLAESDDDKRQWMICDFIISAIYYDFVRQLGFDTRRRLGHFASRAKAAGARFLCALSAANGPLRPLCSIEDEPTEHLNAALYA